MTWIKLEGTVFWTLFVAVFVGVAVWESWRPRRALANPAERRWSRHGLLLVISAVVQALLLRVSPVVLAVAVADNRFGVLNQAWLPVAAAWVLAILAIDLTHYFTHRAFHSFSWLWRVHEVHHSDPDYDVSTAARFHPLEGLLTQGFTLLVIVLLSPPPGAVFVAEILGVVLNLFVHANASLPPAVERVMRLLFITPALHRIHHSDEVAEQSANLGQAFSFWDRIFGTYLRDSRAGEHGLNTGIKGRERDATLSLKFMLGAPFDAGRAAESE